MTRRRWAVACVLAYGVIGALDITAQFLGWDPNVSPADLVMMPLLAAAVLLAAPRGRVTTLVAVGLGFSWVGDCTGELLLAKIVLFLGAQLAYAAAFWPDRHRRYPRVPPAFAPCYALAIIALGVFMASRAGPLAVPVALYGAAVAVMAVLATRVSRVVGIGGFVFLLSDIVLGVFFFLGQHLIPASLAVNSLLYDPAQLLIAVGMVAHLRSRTAQTGPTLAAAAAQ